MARAFPPAWIALFVSYGLGLVGGLGDLPHSPRHEVQLFLADHFARSWWNRLDARWYGGFDITTVPTLAAQFTALVAKVPLLGLERSYALVVVLAGVIFGLGAVRLGACFRRNGEHGWLMLATVAAPGLWLLLVPFGELPAVLAIGLGLNALAFLLEGNNSLDWVAAVALTAGALAAHPLGLLLVAACVPLLMAARGARLLRAGSLGGGVALGLIAAWNSWQAIQFHAVPVHEGLWWGTLGVGLLSAGAGALRRDALVTLGGAAAVALVSFARFAPQAISPTSVLAVACTLALVSLSALEETPAWPTFALAAASFVATGAWLGWEANRDTRSRRQALRQVEWVLANANDGELFRFVTVGVGPEWIELSRRVRPAAVGGGMGGGPGPSLSRGPDLDEFFSTPEGREELKRLLGDRANAIRWAVLGGPGHEVFEAFGFVSVGAWRGSITLLERRDTPPLANSAPRLRTPWSTAILTPLLGAASLVVLALGLAKVRRRTPS